jgi:hypothetical protein
MVGGGEGIDLIEVIALNPVLKLAGFVACIFADFKHGDDDYFYGDEAGLGE